MGVPRGGHRSRSPVLGNIVVLVFLAAVIGLGVRSLATGDTRFGWGMFSHQADWWLSYSWVLGGGELEPFEVPELRTRRRVH